MKFFVKRTSHVEYGEGPEQPCEEAVHDGQQWYVQLSSLEELLEFAEKCDSRLVIFPANYMGSTGTIPTIEIYDDYRE